MVFLKANVINASTMIEANETFAPITEFLSIILIFTIYPRAPHERAIAPNRAPRYLLRGSVLIKLRIDAVEIVSAGAMIPETTG